ncbi:sugar ABC transporter ATP-binding protein [uncultured Robinsoniella sp.]|uniref:sugar ABC transporter ATP-binding protein n=1 Tax=uncultured Robinsoniella sp. TaxID=904190 RepID=UPI00374E7DC0
METNIKLELRNICKSFPGVKALDHVNISLRRGTVHAVMGENGAGKSTLMKIINGLYQRDSGQMLLDGKEVFFASPLESFTAGIAMIYQELNFFPDLTIEENIFMGKHPGKAGMVDWKELRNKVKTIFLENGLDYDPGMKIKELSVSNIQMLEIVKAVAFKAEVIIMDEPTSSISNQEVEALFETIARLRSQGISILYISHKMEEIFRIADDITVIRDGQSIITGPAADFNNDTLIAHMVGRPISNIYPKVELPLGNVIFEIQNLCSKDTFDQVNLTLRKGEIIGMAGLVGAGRTEVARAIFGLDSYDSGTILLHGRQVEIKNVSQAIRSKILMVSEDRKKEGVVGIRSIRENIALASLRVRKGGFLNLRKELDEAKSMSDMLNVRGAGIETDLGSLSGGNQQKVILARWLMLDGEVLILDEPTRGIDVGAKLEIYNIMMKLVKEKGLSIIMISSELPELIGMCDRIYVMNKGYVTGVIGREEYSQERIMKLATKTGGKGEKNER